MAFVTDPIGIIGEEEAAKMLEKKGFRIVEHNWRMGHLEVDLIAENKKEIVFVEVKARTTMFGDIRPEEYVDENKKRRMIAAGKRVSNDIASPKNHGLISSVLWSIRKRWRSPTDRIWRMLLTRHTNRSQTGSFSGHGSGDIEKKNRKNKINNGF